ncbi:GNAT family N-acetyltransferase [Saccharibacillus sp. O23]|nr:GNAT family N-acetyltransferase [Saccharibacillus sp. O23]
MLPSPELTAAIERSEIDYMLDRMTAIQERPGNPEGIEIRRFGGAVAFSSRTMPWPSFNTVKGLTDANLDDLDAILEFYRLQGRKAQLEIVPSRVGPDFLRRLNELGLYQSGFHCSLIGEPRPPVSDRAGQTIAIREIGADEFELYATLHCRGTGLPDEGIPHVRRNNEVLHGRAGWTFFAAESNGVPAAAAVMYERGGIASLTFAATLPEFRRQGLQRALIQHRAAEASARGSKAIVGQCAYLSQSHRNMESVGMKLGYIRTAWTQL